MTDKVLIRSETDADAGIITEITVAAFETLAISNHTEQFIIAALRAAKALTCLARSRSGWARTWGTSPSPR